MVKPRWLSWHCMPCATKVQTMKITRWVWPRRTCSRTVNLHQFNMSIKFPASRIHHSKTPQGFSLVKGLVGVKFQETTPQTNCNMCHQCVRSDGCVQKLAKVTKDRRAIFNAKHPGQGDHCEQGCEMNRSRPGGKSEKFLLF